MFVFSSASGGAAAKNPRKKVVKKKASPAKAKAAKVNVKAKVMRGGDGCATGAMFAPSIQSAQWVAGLPFANSGDPSGNNNAVLSAYGSAESVVPYRQDVVMYDGSGMSAPMGTVFSTGAPPAGSPLFGGGGGRKKPSVRRNLKKKPTAPTASQRKKKTNKKTPAKK